jgi:tetratricopeptide (TPR) repeat protein
MTCLKCCLLLICIFWGSSCLAAEKAILLTDEVQLKIAEAFMDEREYYRAITEYKKYLILFPQSEKNDYVRSRIGAAYYNGEEYEPAIEVFSSLKYKSTDAGTRIQSSYLEALSYWRLNKLEEARLTFRQLASTYPQSEYAPLALAGGALVALENGDIANSRAEMTRFIEDYPEHPGWNRVREAREMLEQHDDLPRKSRVLAGIMSAILPGSGYLYAGHYKDGITSFLINGLAFAGAATGIHQENFAVAGIVTGVGLPFYVGNIYGSANAAKKWNKAVRDKHREKIRTTLGFQF